VINIADLVGRGGWLLLPAAEVR